VNYRYFHNVTHDDFDQLIADLRDGRRDDIPSHGTLGKVRQDLSGDRIANITPPAEQGKPVWIARAEREADTAGAGQ
jgi:hypothetical protein